MKEFKNTLEARMALKRFSVVGDKIIQLTADEWTDEEKAAIEFLVDDCGFEFDSPTIK